MGWWVFVSPLAAGCTRFVVVLLSTWFGLRFSRGNVNDKERICGNILMKKLGFGRVWVGNGRNGRFSTGTLPAKWPILLNSTVSTGSNRYPLRKEFLRGEGLKYISIGGGGVAGAVETV